MATTHEMLALQMDRLLILEKLVAEAGQFDQLTREELLAKVGILEHNWHAFNATNESLADSWKNGLIRKDEKGLTEYYGKRHMLQALTAYTTVKTFLLNLQEVRFERSRHEILDPASSVGNVSTVQCNLPPIPLPSFSGNITEWTSFRDQFSFMVIDRPHVSSVEKMYYLRTSLTADAAQLITDLPVTSNSFPLAWSRLISRYENKKILVDVYLDKLFGQSDVTPRSAQDLYCLVNNTTGILRTLRTFGAPVDQWDMVLVYHITRKLDAKLWQAWELKLASSTDVPSWEALRTFLTARARVLDSIELYGSASAVAR